MATIFTKIANGEIPSYKCAENSRAWSCTDHVADHALITCLIMH